MTTINLNIEYLTYSNAEHLKDFDCCGCQVPFNDLDLQEGNYILGVSDCNEITKEGGTPWDGREKSYKVIMRIKDAEHKNCPPVHRCEKCYSRYRVEEMRKSVKDNNWYCLSNCWRDHSEIKRDAVPQPVKRTRKVKEPTEEKQYESKK